MPKLTFAKLEPHFLLVPNEPFGMPARTYVSKRDQIQAVILHILNHSKTFIHITVDNAGKNSYFYRLCNWRRKIDLIQYHV